MKKLFALSLALVLALGLAAPAMAFTSDTTNNDDVPFKLSLYLVDYEDNDLFGVAALPQSDRGYAKNEIVAAVVEVYVPEDEALTSENNPYIYLTGENVDMNVADNYKAGDLWFATSFSMTDPDLEVYAPRWDIMHPTDHDKIVISFNNLPGEGTYRWLYFAKVTGDDASLTAKLTEGIDYDVEMGGNIAGKAFTLDKVQYTVNRYVINPDGDISYEINVGLGSDYRYTEIYLNTDEDHKSIGMFIRPPFSFDAYALGVNTKGELGIIDPTNPAKLLTDGDIYDDVMDIYNDVVVDVFGLDYMLIGNYLRDSFFNDLVSPRTLTATVDIEPWTAYVTVPDNIVVDPPKTGDAVSIMGFVMVALAGAGGASALLLKKRR